MVKSENFYTNGLALNSSRHSDVDSGTGLELSIYLYFSPTNNLSADVSHNLGRG